MKLSRTDMLVIVAGIALTILGHVLNSHGLSFSGGSLIGSFVFKLGYSWEGYKDL